MTDSEDRTQGNFLPGQEPALGSGRLDVMMLAFIGDHVANQFGWLTVPFAR
jgi:hypothetical protein